MNLAIQPERVRKNNLNFSKALPDEKKNTFAFQYLKIIIN